MVVNEMSGCVGCPMAQDGNQPFVPDEWVDGAKVLILGQAPGADEEKEGRPFCGKTGRVMESTYFPLAGLVRGDNVSIANVLKCRWKKSNVLPPTKILHPAVQHCINAHLRIPLGIELIVCQGALAWKAMGQPTSISAWRGHTIDI